MKGSDYCMGRVCMYAQYKTHMVTKLSLAGFHGHALKVELRTFFLTLELG